VNLIAFVAAIAGFLVLGFSPHERYTDEKDAVVKHGDFPERGLHTH
jgi:hypothetical protein